MEDKIYDMVFASLDSMNVNPKGLTFMFSTALRHASVEELEALSRAFPGNRMNVAALVRAKENGYQDEEAVLRCAKYSMKILFEKRDVARQIVRVISEEIMSMEEYFLRARRLADAAREESRRARLRAEGRMAPLREVISKEEKAALSSAVKTAAE